jgi:hypothetical protein
MIVRALSMHRVITDGYLGEATTRAKTPGKSILDIFAYPLEMVYFEVYRSFETILRQIFYPGYAK